MRSRTDDAVLDGRLHDDSPIADLMRALQAPETPDEYAGLDQAMSAFFTVGPASRAATGLAARPRPTTHRKTVSAARRALVIKLATLFGGASIIGGVALAAHELGGTDAPSHHRGTGPSQGVQPGNGLLTWATQGGAASTTAPVAAHPSKHRSGHPSATGAGHGGGVGQSVHPTHPTHPSHPTHPTHPSHPTGKHSPTPHATPSASTSTKSNPGQVHRSSAPGQSRTPSKPGKHRPSH